jgi:hypothetical protein
VGVELLSHEKAIENDSSAMNTKLNVGDWVRVASWPIPAALIGRFDDNSFNFQVKIPLLAA